MAKTRLTKADREAIRDAIIKHKFTPLEADVRAEENALALQARAKAYGDYLTVIEAAPKGAFGEDDDVNLNVAGRRIRLRFGADYTTRARLYFDHCRSGYLMSLPESDKFGAKVLAWADKAEANRKARSDLRSNVLATLAAFNTFDDLLAGWPEADAFITARWRERPDYSANVPAVALRDLSAALDLPPDVAEAA